MPRILVVEDHEMSLRLMRAVLEAHGHSVLEAATVPAARRVLAAQLPDLVMLDIQVPGGGGEALLHELRADPRLAAIPAVAVTAMAMEQDRVRLLAAGFDAYVSKPIDTGRVPALVDVLLRRARARPN